MRDQNREHPEVIVTSDVSGTWGCGGRQWFQLQWSTITQDAHITIKELDPIVITGAIWGKNWYGRTVQARCDNAAVVAILNWGSSQDPKVMHLMRCLAFIQARFQFYLFSHIQGIKNDLADAISRNNADYFKCHYQQAAQHPSPIPQELLDLMLISKTDWISALWTGLWSTIFAVD